MSHKTKLSDVELNEANDTFTAGTLEVTFTVSHSQDAKDRAKSNGYDGNGEETAVDVPHTAVIDLAGTPVEEVLQYAAKPRVISLQNQLKKKYDNEEAFDNAVRDGRTAISMVPERTTRKDPKKDLSGFIAGLDAEEKAGFMQALEDGNEAVDAWLDEYYGDN